MNKNMNSAVPGEGVDEAVAWHYGDPLREQRMLATAAGLVDRSHRGVVSVPGVDRLRWLHSISTQFLENLADGETTEALVLSPNGHVEQHWVVTEIDDVVWLDVEPGTASTALEYLEKMRFLMRVEPADVSADWAVLSLIGPSSASVLERAGLPVPGARAARFDNGFVRVVDGGYDLLVRRDHYDGVSAALVEAGAEPAGLWAYEALRVEARRPRLNFETDHRTIPHEVGWIGRAVHLNKGCYRGQETVARVHNLGKPPRRLVLLHLSGESEQLPAQGTPIELDGRSVGFLGTALHHYELGPIALAVIKRTVSDDVTLTVGGMTASMDPAPNPLDQYAHIHAGARA